MQNNLQHYFPHDSNARNADSLLSLRMRRGAEGYGIYFMILERLREEPDYTSVKDYNMLAFDFRVGSDKVKSVIEEFGLFHFTEDGERFYSESFLRRMQLKDEKSAKARAAAVRRWNTTETAIPSPADADAMPTQCLANATKENPTQTETKQGSKKVATHRSDTLGRRENFRQSLEPFVARYGREMVDAFADYWSELTPSGQQMRFELERTWETARRLAIWHRRAVAHTTSGPGSPTRTSQDGETIGRDERRSTTL